MPIFTYNYNGETTEFEDEFSSNYQVYFALDLFFVYWISYM